MIGLKKLALPLGESACDARHAMPDMRCPTCDARHAMPDMILMGIVQKVGSNTVNQ